jgi:Amt family ammonium transporter
LVFKIIDLIIGNRVSAKSELEGLDLPEMGAEGYSGIKMDKNSETPLSR